MGVLDKFLNVMKLTMIMMTMIIWMMRLMTNLRKNALQKNIFSKRMTILMRMMIFRMTSRSKKPEKPRQLRRKHPFPSVPDSSRLSL